MPTVRNFHEKLEQDLQRVTSEIARKREATPDVSPREIVKQSLATIAPVPPQSSKNSEEPTSPASDYANIPSYLSEESPEVKKEVERLVSLAFEEGIGPAVAVAAKRSPFILDALHDALTDKLLPELEKRGMFK